MRFRLGLLGINLESFTTIGLPGGCDLYLDGSFIVGPVLADGNGDAQIPVPVPPGENSIFRCDVFFQYAVSDPNGAFSGFLASSDGLRNKIGS